MDLDDNGRVSTEKIGVVQLVSASEKILSKESFGEMGQKKTNITAEQFLVVMEKLRLRLNNQFGGK